MKTQNQHSVTNNWQSFSKIYRYNKKSRVHYWFYGLIVALLIILFLPWTQNIRAKGKCNYLTAGTTTTASQYNYSRPGIKMVCERR